jgi:hypothetical protein
MKYLSGLFVLAAIVIPACAQEIPTEGPVPTTATVRVESKTKAVLSPDTLTLQVNGHRTPIDSVTSVSSQPVELAILIDDGLRSGFNLQLQDLKKFIGALPGNVHVMVGYMQNGTIRKEEEGFTADHSAAADNLRVAMGAPGASASPYFCLSDFVKHWPSRQAATRAVLMITNGVDPYNGRPSVMNQDSPYVQAAQDDAQRAGVAVYALYYGDAGMRGGGASFSGQSYLQQLASATGGESLYNGTFSPTTFTPYLERLMADLRESYVLGFRANATHEKANALMGIKVKSSQPGVKVYAPEAVHPGVEE